MRVQSAALNQTGTLDSGVLPARPGGLVEDTTLPYATGHRTGACRLRVYVPSDQPVSATHPAIVLVTEQPEREGLSVTNGIEIIAATVCASYGLDPRHTVLIEHYDDRERGGAAHLPGRVDGEKFSCVVFGEMDGMDGGAGIFRLAHPQWHRLSKDQVEALIAQPLP